ACSQRVPNPSLAGMSRPSPAPALDGGVLLEEILLRLPPQPSSLPRASLVCTRWRRILSDPGFRRRFREHHGRNNPPPLLGFFEKEFRVDKPPIFNTTATGERDRIPPARFSAPWSLGEGWEFLGCRHGLALLICRARREAIVWDPLTGHRRRVAFPPGWKSVQNAAVMCAAAGQDGHVHGDCRFSPFRLALVRGGSNGTRHFACLYESESGVWGDIASVETEHSTSTCIANPSVLLRNSFCWLLSGGAILEFDFQNQSLAVIQKPADAHAADYYWSFYVKTIQLDGLFSPGPTMGQNAVMMQGYNEDTDAIFLSTFFGNYMLQLETTQFTNLPKTRRNCMSSRTFYPYRNFYITCNSLSLSVMTPLVLAYSA
uniref:F-box domain-containing protein n=1 Tax=Aegilops tauschii subsp. strangulata TaxID=200361 RepID=A0A453J417_AEGTS